MKIFTPYAAKLLLPLLLFAGSLQAQTQETEQEFTSFEEVKNYMNNIFSRLEKQRVPYGILLDKAVSIGDITDYDGITPKEERDTLDVSTLFQVTTTLATAKITDNPQVVVPPEDLEPIVERFTDENKVTLGGVFYKYARLKPDLREDQLIMEGGVLHDSYINGVWQNPYEVKQSFVLTPIDNFYSGQEVAVQLPSDLWFSNMNDSIQGIEVDFDNGEEV